MGDKEILNSKTARVFIKSSLEILGIFLVLSYGFAAFALYFVNKNCGTDPGELMRLVWVLVIATLIVLCGHLWLVIWLHSVGKQERDDNA
jgi:O-antigen/teichoic acid export membrane protein